MRPTGCSPRPEEGLRRAGDGPEAGPEAGPENWAVTLFGETTPPSPGLVP
jgi:hypothetical protein